jgi:hypothetical protein
VRITCEDFNGAHKHFGVGGGNAPEWLEVEQALTQMYLHLKPSLQAGILGDPIFDPIGTNLHIKTALHACGWAVNEPIPAEFYFLGSDVDAIKNAVVLEAQFSNYPFLLNNLIRAELLHKGRVPIAGSAVEGLIIVTKCVMFPASQSTLYYEQAVSQVEALSKNHVFDLPIRLVGLSEEVGTTVPAVWSEYDGRTSRTIVRTTNYKCDITAGARSPGRCRLTLS